MIHNIFFVIDLVHTTVYNHIRSRYIPISLIRQLYYHPPPNYRNLSNISRQIPQHSLGSYVAS